MALEPRRGQRWRSNRQRRTVFTYVNSSTDVQLKLNICNSEDRKRSVGIFESIDHSLFSISYRSSSLLGVLFRRKEKNEMSTMWHGMECTRTRWKRCRARTAVRMELLALFSMGRWYLRSIRAIHWILVGVLNTYYRKCILEKRRRRKKNRTKITAFRKCAREEPGERIWVRTFE